MTSRTTRTKAHRIALGLVGTIAALALTASSVAAQDTDVDPEPNIEARRITGGVAPLEGQTEASPAFTGYEAMIPRRPKGMWRKTYDRLFEAVIENESRAEERLTRMAALLLDLDRRLETNTRKPKKGYW